MAETNTTASPQDTIRHLIAGALGIAKEIEAEGSKDYCLASSIADMLDEHSTAKGLADMLEERIADSSQMQRLVKTLEQIMCGVDMPPHEEGAT